MNVTYGKGFEVRPPPTMREKVLQLQSDLSKLPQYEPVTEHYFHAGMYCRKVWRAAGVLVVGKVHKKEHFYLVVSGTIRVTTDAGVERIIGPYLLKSLPGTKRAVYSETDALCMTFHRTDALTVEDAETDLVEEEEQSMYDAKNLLKPAMHEVLP